MLVMKLRRIAVLLVIALVLGILLGVASQRHPGITNALWVSSPFVLLVAMCTFIVTRDNNSSEDRREMQYVYIAVMAYAALCVGNFVGLLV